MRKKISLLALLFLMHYSDNLTACSCIGVRTVRQEIKYCDALLVGTIIAKQIVTFTDPSILDLFPKDSAILNSPMSKITLARFDFLVGGIYKGKIDRDTVTIFTGLGGGDCGIRFEIGKMYIVYGVKETYLWQVKKHTKSSKIKNTFWTYSCLRTTSYNQHEIDEIEQYTKKKRHLTEKNTYELIDPAIPPAFKNGGDMGLKQFIKENLRYPQTGECVSGKVLVGFTVDTLGNVKDIEIKRGITKATDEEAIRVVKLLTFTPGTWFGKPIETKMLLPFDFTMEE